MSLGQHYVTLIPTPQGDIAWDLRSGTPDGVSVRIDNGEASTWAAACHQAGGVMQRRARDHFFGEPSAPAVKPS